MGRRGKRKSPDRSARAQGRELAFLVLCHLESYAADEREDAVALFWEQPPGADGDGPLAVVGPAPEWVQDAATRSFAERLISGVIGHWDELDALIESSSRRWRIARMDRVDRNVLRLVAAELQHEHDTPRAVVLAEAVRLASSYGSERSAGFVNGVAETLARALRPSD